MCDLAYINFLREKVRRQEAAEERIANFGTPPTGRFVPWIMPDRSPSQDASGRPTGR